MDLTVAKEGKWVVVFARGRIDAFNQELLVQRFSTLIKAGCRYIAIDLSDVHHLSVPVARVLARYAKELRNQDGLLSVITPRREILELFNVFISDDQFWALTSRGGLTS